MARFANIRPEQINKAKRMLQDLPEKTERKTRQEAALLLESDLRKALKKGYGPRTMYSPQERGNHYPDLSDQAVLLREWREFVRTLFGY